MTDCTHVINLSKLPFSPLFHFPDIRHSFYDTGMRAHQQMTWMCCFLTLERIPILLQSIFVIWTSLHSFCWFRLQSRRSPVSIPCGMGSSALPASIKAIKYRVSEIDIFIRFNFINHSSYKTAYKRLAQITIIKVFSRKKLEMSFWQKKNQLITKWNLQIQSRPPAVIFKELQYARHAWYLS